MINMVVAYDRERGIGKDNGLPWSLDALPTDLRHFKALTLGHAIVMGRKTYESIGRPLPGRRNIVVTRHAGMSHPDVEYAPSLDAAIAQAGNATEVDIIGGGEIFRQAVPLADRVYATEVDGDFSCDTTFPELPSDV